MASLILDVMGGDFAPHCNLLGAVAALAELEALARSTPSGESDELVLVGDETAIRPLLTQSRYRRLAAALKQPATIRVRIHHSTEIIGMEDSIRAIRSKPNATINVGNQMAAESYRNGKPAAFVSAGHSGAMMASALLQMGRIKGVERPAIAVRLPSLSPDGCILIDVGANIDCKAENLRDFAIMGTLFAQVDRQQPSLPRIGVMSNGEEPSKGTDLTREALALIGSMECFKPDTPGAIGVFRGYAEGKEIFKGNFDVIVTDGFTGNVALKAAEGLGSAIFSLLKSESKRGWLVPLGFLLSKSAFRALKRKVDYDETGAAPLLGVAGYSFVCHGRSNSRAIKNALLRARRAVEGRMIERMEEAFVAAISQAGVSSPQEPRAEGQKR